MKYKYIMVCFLVFFSINSIYSEEGIVTIGNLNWMKCTGESTDCTGEVTRMEWKEAIEYCKKLSLGKKKWRLPKLSELKSLITCTGGEMPEYRTKCGKDNKITPTISLELFPSTQKSLYWTSDPSSGSPYQKLDINNHYHADMVNFKDGFSNYNVISAKSLVRCVSQ